VLTHAVRITEKACRLLCARASQVRRRIPILPVAACRCRTLRADGLFDRACRRLLAGGFRISWVDRVDDEANRKPRATRCKYTCPGCALNVWAKPDIRVRCGDCDVELRPVA
jgi:hypothetical protein